MKQKALIFLLLLLVQRSDSEAQSIPPKRAHHDLVYEPSAGLVLMTAGSTPVNEGRSGIFFNDLWSYDGKGWKFIANTGNKRSGMRLAYDTKRRKLFSFGGYSEQGSHSDLRVLENNEWKTVAELAGVKSAEPGFVYDEARDRLIVFGGSSGPRQVNSDTWEWDGSAWKKFEGDGPPGRQAFAMVYDARRKRTVLYAGMDGSGKKMDDGIWEFDGTKWTNIMPAGDNPGPLLSPGYAYDSKRGLLIISGGLPGDDAKGHTWSWDGKEWKLLSEKGPSPRAMGYMTYDAARDRIVLFGGRLGWPVDANDTWEWDGKEWKEIK